MPALLLYFRDIRSMMMDLLWIYICLGDACDTFFDACWYRIRRLAVLDFSDIRLFVLDLDGTFYLGDRIFDFSLDFLRTLEETGREYMFFTNNSSRSPMDYVKRLNGMGCRITRRHIMTSGDIMIEYLRRYYPEKTVYLLGTPALEESFRQEGIRLFNTGGACGYRPDIEIGADAAINPDLDSRSDAVKKSAAGIMQAADKKCDVINKPARPDIVVVGFDKTLTYEKLVCACRYIREGAEYLATHPDINCPVPGGFDPDCGAMCALISLSTGRQPIVLGKPAAETVEMIVAKTGFKPWQIAFVGDRLYTDVAAGVRNGSRGLLVLSGEATMADVEASDVKPDGIYADLGDIGREVRRAWQGKIRNERPEEPRQRH